MSTFTRGYGPCFLQSTASTEQGTASSSALVSAVQSSPPVLHPRPDHGTDHATALQRIQGMIGLVKINVAGSQKNGSFGIVPYSTIISGHILRGYPYLWPYVVGISPAP